MSSTSTESETLLGHCALCDEVTTLRLSHIMPRFIVKWIKSKENSFIPSFLTHESPQKPVQEMKRLCLLGSCCEQRFGNYERLFERKIFTPFVSNQTFEGSMLSEPWFLKASISYAWRVCQHFLRTVPKEVPQDLVEQCMLSSDIWRKYLLEQSCNLPIKPEWQFRKLDDFDPSDAASLREFQNLPEWYFNYVFRMTDYTISFDGKNGGVYFKLPGFMMWQPFGIDEPESSNTKVMIESLIQRRADFVKAHVMSSTSKNDVEKRTSQVNTKLSELEKEGFFKTPQGIAFLLDQQRKQH